MHEAEEEKPVPGQLFKQFYQSQINYRLLVVAAELNIADILSPAPLSTEALASKTGTKPQPLFRVMRALIACGVFKQVSPGVFSNNLLSETLRQDVPDSQWAIIRQSAPGWGYHEGFSEVIRTLKTGKTAVDDLWGHDIWEFYRRNPEKSKVFNKSMRAYTAAQTPPITAAYNWGQYNSMCDVGGGIGTQISDILKAYPNSHGMVFDLPEVIENLAPQDRLVGQGGDFFKEVPGGFDAYFLRSVLHDWDDEACIKIMKSVLAACQPESKIIVIDMVIPEGDEFHFGKLIDMTMMLVAGGKERTAVEFQQLFEQAGFNLDEIVPTDSNFSLIIGSPKV